MSHRDWSEFEAALESPEERARILKSLESDPANREELEGFLAFLEEIRRKGLEVKTPTESLETILSGVVEGERNPLRLFSWRRLAIPLAAAGALALGIWWARRDPMNFAVTPTAAVLEAPTEGEAEQWIESHTNFDVPPLTFPKDSILVNARYGVGGEWACMDFMYHGQTFWLYVKKGGGQLENGSVKTFDGRKFYDGKGIGWKSRSLAYYLKGGSHAERWSFASFLAPQTQQ